MGKRGGEADQSSFIVDRGGLYSRDLMAAKRLAHDVKAARERRIAKGLILIARVTGFEVYRLRQSSNPSPPTRMNSRALCVTILSPRRKAQAASSRS